MDTIFYRLNAFWNNHKKEKSIEGRLIRLGLDKYKSIPKEDKNIEKFVYGIATGGFGCTKNSMGHAIFVDFIGETRRETSNKIMLNIQDTGDRWESYFRTLEISDLTIEDIKREGDE